MSKFPVPPTRSTTHTIIYLTSGVATMKIGFQPVLIRAHECLVVPAGQVFSYDQYEVNTGFISKFAPDFLIDKVGGHTLLNAFDFLTAWGNPVIRPNPNTAKYLTQTWQRVFDEYTRHGLAHPMLIRSYYLAALCELNTCYQPLLMHKSGAAVALTNRFKALLSTHIREKHTTTDYATLLHVTPNHLNKSVKKVTGKSASQWINETLVTEAKVLLYQTHRSIGEIAAELGVLDSSYFSRFFKKHEGVTPLAFRKMIDSF